MASIDVVKILNIEIFGRALQLKIHWYGLMYLVGFVGGWLLGVQRAKRPHSGWRPDEVGDLLFYVALGVIAGGRRQFP